MMRIVTILLLLLGVSKPMSAQCDHPDYEGLVELYNATDGATWRYSTGWISLINGIENCDICTWRGVTCEEDRVVELHLESNYLSGTIPDLNLTELKVLNLNSNDLLGDIPNFSNLPKLEELTISSNELSGSLVNFESLPDLRIFDCSKNEMMGPIPSFEHCTLLTTLALERNPINDTIPDFIHLPGLTEFRAVSAELYGRFPRFSNNKKITTINVASNNLSGFLPDLSEHLDLKFIWAEDNDLEGCYPALPVLEDTPFFFASPFHGNWRMPFFGESPILAIGEVENIGAPCRISEFPNHKAIIDEDCKCVFDACQEAHPDMPALMEIYNSTGGENWIDNSGWKAAAEGFRCDPCSISYGAFYGVWCKNGRVVCIDLDGSDTCDFNGFGGNNLTGHFPKVHLPYLTSLILDDNNLKGEIPDISGLHRLEELRISNNNLTGEIPHFFDNPALSTIRLSYNNLYGDIPPNKMTRGLEFLTLAENNLSGCYPDWICDLELFDATANNALPWKGDYDMFCDGVSEDKAPCVDALDNEGLIIDCACCQISPDPQSEHICLQTLYPNPTKSELYISSLGEGKECFIYDMKGQLVMKQRMLEGKLNVSLLDSGVYILSFWNFSFEKVTHKFVKL